MRKKGKVDLNQFDIVMALRAIGVHVAITSNLGGGFPDIVCLYNSRVLLMEIKSKGGRMTAEEQAFYNEWQDGMVVVYSVEEAIEAVRRLI